MCGDKIEKTNREKCKECMTEFKAAMKACGADEACQIAAQEKANGCRICAKQ